MIYSVIVKLETDRKFFISKIYSCNILIYMYRDIFTGVSVWDETSMVLIELTVFYPSRDTKDPLLLSNLLCDVYWYIITIWNLHRCSYKILNTITGLEKRRVFVSPDKLSSVDDIRQGLQCLDCDHCKTRLTKHYTTSQSVSS